MTPLDQTYQLLMNGMQQDPLLSLAYVVSWLDPFWMTPDDDDLMPGEDENDTLLFTLRILRDCFPDVYALAVEQVRAGATYQQLDRLICGHMEQIGLPLNQLEEVAFGIPFPAYGVALDEPEFYEQNPELLPVLEAFGVHPNPNPYHIDVPDCVYKAGQMIAEDLEQHPDERYRQISWLLQWLFGCSGNSVVDWDYESISEVQPLAWDRENVTLAIEIIREADDIMREARAGLQFLTSNPAVLDALRKNIQRVYRALKRQKGKKRRDLKVKLKWC